MLTVCAKCRTLQLAAIHAAPKHLWDWPSTDSDSPRHHRRLVTFLLPLVMREVIRGMVLSADHAGDQSRLVRGAELTEPRAVEVGGEVGTWALGCG